MIIKHRNKNMEVKVFAKENEARLAGMKTKITVFKKGRKYLVPLKKSDASWLVIDREKLGLEIIQH